VQPGKDFTPKYELFDIANDPYEQTDLAAKLPDEVAKLKKEYEAWFASVTAKGFDPPRIIVGSEKENPVRLTRQDWRGEKAGWGPESEGHWEVAVERAGRYELTVRSRREFESARVTCSYGGPRGGPGVSGPHHTPKPLRPPTLNATRFTVNYKPGPARIEATVVLQDKRWGADYLELKYLGPGGN
jgi:hypothetical protein